MSLARFGATPLAFALFGVISVALPRLPHLGLLFPNSNSMDPRLEELKKQMEKNGGRPPFMVDNGAILRAAPKKRPSHRRTREKLYAPGDKQIQHLENLGRCPACGHVKRSHLMCMHCFAEIRTFLKAKKRLLFPEAEAPQSNLDPVDEKILYPGKYQSNEELKLQQKKWVPKREVPLMFNPEQLKKEKK